MNSLAIEAVHVESPLDLAAVLQFYRGELGKRGWTENADGTVGPDRAEVTFTTTDGPALLRLTRQNDRTVADLSRRKPAAADSGLRPKPGQARLRLGNTRDEEAIITINERTIKLAAKADNLTDDTKTASKSPDNVNLDLPPGKYKARVKLAGGAAQSREFELVADETWGLLVGPAGVPLPVHLY